MIADFPAHLHDVWTWWHDHFVIEGSSPERAQEEADATVRGLYLSTVSAVVEGPAHVGFVATPKAPHLSKTLPPFRWSDVVPMPPGSSQPLTTSRRRGRSVRRSA